MPDYRVHWIRLNEDDDPSECTTIVRASSPEKAIEKGAAWFTEDELADTTVTVNELDEDGDPVARD